MLSQKKKSPLGPFIISFSEYVEERRGEEKMCRSNSRASGEMRAMYCAS